MKIASDELWYTWEQGQFYGANKPQARVVVSKTVLTTSNELFRTLLFSNPGAGDQFYEIPQLNLKTLSRNHRVGTDSATLTLVIRNAGPIVVEEDLDQAYDLTSTSPTKRELKEQGEPGKYTYRRGLSSDGSRQNPWGYAATEFVDLFLPNRVVRTFEGYGTDGAEYPWDDTKQVLTGTWLIDRVQIDAAGSMTVECRDLAKLLIEQRLYPPIVPFDSYPINFCSDSTETNTVTSSASTTTSTPEVTGPNVAHHSSDSWDSSAAPWYGTNANVFGHRASHAFDGDPTTFWISMRNSKPSEDWSYEWLDLVTDGEPINRVKFRPWVGGYTLYVGIMEGGVWQGSATVPYNRTAPPAYPNTSDIKYVKKINMPAGEEWFNIELDRIYDADRVRLVFTDLQWFGRIANGDYRAGVYEAQAFGFTPAGNVTTTIETEEEVIVDIPGNITDYTDMIKLFLAWSGYYWPQDGSIQDDPLFLVDEWGAKGGRVWGDFFYSGAYPVEPPCIDPAYWDNKSVMDAINQIKEILGFIGYVDNTGGFIWRPPNIWANGNYVTGLGYRRGDTAIPVVEERNLLLDYGVTVDDASLRSEIVVISSDDPTVHGSYSPGYASGEESPTSLESLGTIAGDQVVTDLSLLAGQQRVMLVPDYPFGQGQEDELAARAEVEKFAYLVSLWIHWSYRKGRVKIPANPALDVDDQVRIYEAKTSETYIHYILSQTVSLDFDTGVYTADLETHWLGNGPEASWHMFVNDLPPALLAYLCQQGIMEGAICGDENTEGSSTPWSPGTLPDVPDTPIEVPRTPDDLVIPFPKAPTVIPIPPGGEDPESSGDPGVDNPPSGTSGGSVTSKSNQFFFNFWPNTGPNYASSSNAGRFWFRGANGTQSDCILDTRTFAAFRLLSDIFIEKGVEVHYASGKVIRYVRNTTQWSNHSWGVACDVNSKPLVWNKSIYDHPVGIRNPMLYIASRASEIRTTGNKPVFYWGEHFSNPDPMHWQIVVKASELAGGVVDIGKTPPP